MAEQDVRPHQLSIAEIAKLWSAETGDSAEELQRELAEWAYAATVDGATVGAAAATDGRDTSTKLKVEPDPERKLRRDDVESFCRDRDRLLPHFWPGETGEARAASERGAGGAAPESKESGDDISRLLIRAMDRLGPAAMAERRAPGVPGGQARGGSSPRNPGAAPAGPRAAVDTVTLVAKRAEIAAPDPVSEAEAGTGEPEAPVEPATPPDGAASKNRRRPIAKVMRAAASAAAPRDRDADAESPLVEVPVQVMRPGPGPAPAAAPQSRRAPGPVPSLLAGILVGAILALAGAAAWIQAGGQNPTALLNGNGAPAADPGAPERQAAHLAEAETRAAEAVRDAERLAGELSDARRQNDTLRARIADIGVLGERLSEAQDAGAALRGQVAELSTALEAARAGGDANRQAIQDELDTTRQALEGARREAKERDEALARAQSEIEAGVQTRQQIEARAEALAAELSAARAEAENLASQNLAAQEAAQETAQETARRLEFELAAARQEIGALSANQDDLEASLANASGDLTAARERLEALVEANAAAERDRRRLGAELTAARQDADRVEAEKAAAIARATDLEKELSTALSATASLRGETEDLKTQNAQLTRDLADTRQSAEARAEELAGKLAGAEDEAAALRATLEGANGNAEAVSARLAAEQRRTAQLTRDLADTRQSAEARAEELAGKLAGAEDEAAALRTTLEGANGSAEEISARLAAEQRRTAQLDRDRDTALARIEALDRDRETALARIGSLEGALSATRTEVTKLQASAAKAEDEKGLLLDALDGWKTEALALTAAQTEAKRQAPPPTARADAEAQARIESLTVALAATQAELNDLQALSARADNEKALLLDAVEGWKAEALFLADTLAETDKRAAVDLRPQAAPSKEELIGPPPEQSGETGKLHSVTTLAAIDPASDSAAAAANPLGPRESVPRPPARQPARPDDPAGRMLSRGDQYLKLGDVASARLFYRQAADMGATAALSAVARTYDPRTLKTWGVLVGFADPDTAADWYRRAIAAGDGQADKDLAALRAWLEP